MKIGKWVKLRIFIVSIGILFVLGIIFMRFMFLQLRAYSLWTHLLFFALFSVFLLLLLKTLLYELGDGNRYINLRVNKETTGNSAALAIEDLIISKKISKGAVASALIFFASLIHLLLVNLLNYQMSLGGILFIVILMFAIVINQFILEYRIKKGFYGNSDYEAREIIDFILANASASGITGGDGFNKIFLTPESIEELMVDTQPDGLQGVKG